ncbi:lactate utilization protein [Cellulosilyticum ruminicola]|uniref:lactate utilization protein n=1 Tax=Cellulosilyticum ruminicola TaxID=425254 RepID=UPI0006D226EB|nr:lactate utilization protein [Cellulosilyticum ruminicola]
MENKKLYFKIIAENMVSEMAKRGIEGHYVCSKEEAKDKALSFLEDGMTITWGGSMTLSEIDLFKALEQKGTYNLLDRSKVSAEEVPDIYRKAFTADTYFMSTNAITQKGELVNTDGTGNRVAALIYGPKQVIVIAGMNKVVKDVDAAIERIHQIAAPINAMRLNKQTPCGKTGTCHNCLSPDCICMQTVVTRNSKPEGRIKVILVGEALGY